MTIFFKLNKIHIAATVALLGGAFAAFYVRRRSRLPFGHVDPSEEGIIDFPPREVLLLRDFDIGLKKRFDRLDLEFASVDEGQQPVVPPSTGTTTTTTTTSPSVMTSHSDAVEILRQKKAKKIVLLNELITQTMLWIDGFEVPSMPHSTTTTSPMTSSSSKDNEASVEPNRSSDCSSGGDTSCCDLSSSASITPKSSELDATHQRVQAAIVQLRAQKKAALHMVLKKYLRRLEEVTDHGPPSSTPPSSMAENS